MITIKYSSQTGAEGKALGTTILEQIKAGQENGVALDDVKSSEMMPAGPGKFASGFYDLIIEVLLSEAAQFALEKLYASLKKLIRDRKKAKIQVRVVQQGSYLQDFDTAVDEEKAVDKLEYQVRKIQ